MFLKQSCEKGPLLPLSGYSLEDQFQHQPFIVSRKGGTHLVHNNFIYRSNMKRMGRRMDILYWECIHNRNTKCRGRVKTMGNVVIPTNVTGKSAFVNLYKL